MRQDYDFRILLPDIDDILDSELFMHLTAPTPTNHIELLAGNLLDGALLRENNLLPRFPGNIFCQELIWKEDHAIAIQRVYDSNGIAGRTADVALGFNIGIGIDVSNHR